MKWIFKAGYLTFIIAITNSCSMIRKSPKTEFTDGFYIEKKANHQNRVYVTIEDDVLRVRPTVKDTTSRVIDTIAGSRFYLKYSSDDVSKNSSFQQYSFDVDFLTIPLKFRPARQGVPLQLNTNLNGAVYLGYRTDTYNVDYVANPLNKLQRTINHYGFSMGVFTGIGNTFMSSTTTDNNIAIEYDGVVWTKGIAAIIAINNFTIGLAFGLDNLLDTNRKIWIYETKPWFGLTFGLNLN